MTLLHPLCPGSEVFLVQNLHWGSASWETCSTMSWEDSTTTLGTCLGERDALRDLKGDWVDDLESETGQTCAKQWKMVEF